MRWFLFAVFAATLIRSYIFCGRPILETVIQGRTYQGRLIQPKHLPRRSRDFTNNKRQALTLIWQRMHRSMAQRALISGGYGFTAGKQDYMTATLARVWL